MYLDKIKEAYLNQEWEKCIELCRNAIQHIPTLKTDKLYYAKKVLAIALLNVEDNFKNTCDEAIQIFEQLISQLEPLSDEWSKLQKNLGWAYYERPQNNRVNNLTRCIYHYKQALIGKYYEADKELLASIKAYIAYSLNELVLNFSSEFEQKEIKNMLKESHKYLKSSLEIFRSDQYPEEYKEAQAAFLWVNDQQNKI